MVKSTLQVSRRGMCREKGKEVRWRRDLEQAQKDFGAKVWNKTFGKYEKLIEVRKRKRKYVDVERNTSKKRSLAGEVAKGAKAHKQ